MFCKNCGAQIDKSVVFCTRCGIRVAKEENPADLAQDAVFPGPERLEPAEPARSEPIVPARLEPAGTERPRLEPLGAEPQVRPEPSVNPEPQVRQEPVQTVPEYAASNDPTPLSQLPPLPPPPAVPKQRKKTKTYFGTGALVFCLILIAILSVSTGIFAGLYFSIAG